MKLIIYRFVAFVFLSGSLISASGQERYVRIRTIGGMEPIGVLYIKGDGGTVETPLSTSYGFSPGLEVYYVLKEFLEFGAGFQWQLKRKALLEKKTGTFSSIPIYSTTRINLTRSENFSMYVLIKLGYSILNSSSEFREIWDSEPGGSLDSTRGGFYGMTSLGMSKNLKETSNWKLDFGMDVGYSFQSFIGSNSAKSYPLSYHEMPVHISLDWLF